MRIYDAIRRQWLLIWTTARLSRLLHRIQIAMGAKYEYYKNVARNCNMTICFA